MTKETERKKLEEKLENVRIAALHNKGLLQMRLIELYTVMHRKYEQRYGLYSDKKYWLIK